MLSQTKRASLFDWMSDEEIARFIPLVNDSFAQEPDIGNTGHEDSPV